MIPHWFRHSSLLIKLTKEHSFWTFIDNQLCLLHKNHKIFEWIWYLHESRIASKVRERKGCLFFDIKNNYIYRYDQFKINRLYFNYKSSDRIISQSFKSVWDLLESPLSNLFTINIRLISHCDYHLFNKWLCQKLLYIFTDALCNITY